MTGHTHKQNKCITNANVVEAGQENPIIPDGFGNVQIQRPKLFLHSCCGPCSTSVIERLISDYDITVFFYNPNIEKEEYDLRKVTQRDFIEQFNKDSLWGKVNFVEGEYDIQSFQQVTVGLESEVEGGKRCEACFRLRLERTAQRAKASGFHIFATTLTVSPYKNYDIITMIGSEMSLKYDIEYLADDFKKKDGYCRSIQLSKKYKLYRQHFCGCSYSK